MCGIAGIFPIGNRLRPEQLDEQVESMCDMLLHRGPDARGKWMSEWGAALGHTRLTIIDLAETSNQPMADVDEKSVISFNGEIYNYKELREELEKLGHRFRTQSDTEVLLNALNQWGVDCLEKLDGMYAFAYVDLITHEILLARDPFGEKPLYYFESEGKLYFASELTAFQSIPSFKGEISEAAIAEYLTFQYTLGPESFFKQVRKLQPGSWIHYDDSGKISSARHFEYNPSPDKEERSLDELSEELESILTTSLKRRLRSDVPLGLFLSGGIDSSLVASLATQKLNRNIKSFSLGFRNAEDSEHDEARSIAELLGLDHHQYLLNENDLLQSHKIAESIDEPNGDTSLLPFWHLSKFARNHVKVALSGDGADELFLGYNRYSEVFADVLSKHEDSFLGNRYYNERILIFVEHQIRELMDSVPAVFEQKLQCLRDTVNHTRYDWFDRLRKTDIENYLPGAVLAKVDRMSMSHGLECRTPFLSREVASFSEKLSIEHLHNRSKGKIILRNILSKYLPDRVIDRRKTGFGIPMGHWGQQTLSNAWYDQSEKNSKYLVWWLKNEFYPRELNSYQLWTMLILSHFMRSNAGVPTPLNITPTLALFAKKLSHSQSDHLTVGTDRSIPDWIKTLGVSIECLSPFSENSKVSVNPDALTPKYRLEDVDANDPHNQRISKRTYYSPLWFDYKTDQVTPFSARSIFKQFHRNLRVTFSGLLSNQEKKEAVFSDDYFLFRSDTPIRAFRFVCEYFDYLRSRVHEKWAFHMARMKQQETNESFSRPEKVAIVISNLGAGGAERQAVLLALELAKKDLQVVVIVFSSLGGPNGHYFTILSNAGIQVVSLNTYETNGLPCDFLSPDSQLIEIVNGLPRFLKDDVWKLAYYFRNNRPDAVHALLDHSNIVAGWAGLLVNIPSVALSFRNLNPTHFPFYQTWFKRHYRYLIRQNAVKLCGNSTIGNDDYAQWLKIEPQTISLTPNGIDLHVFNRSEHARHDTRKKNAIGDEQIVILGAFRFSKEKRPEDFVQVCERVCEKHPTCCIFLAGEGPLGNIVEESISQSNYRQNFRMLGRIENIQDWMSASDVLLLCSENEGTPNVVIEAQASSLPVVATKAGGTSECFVDQKTGFLHEIGDIEGLSQSVNELIENSELRLKFGKDAKKHAHEHFSLSRAADHVLKLHHH